MSVSFPAAVKIPTFSKRRFCAKLIFPHVIEVQFFSKNYIKVLHCFPNVNNLILRFSSFSQASRNDLKVHKREKFLVSDFEFFTILYFVKLKY
jgi:hypothetical protein